jgi:hypothetical protein
MQLFPLSVAIRMALVLWICIPEVLGSYLGHVAQDLRRSTQYLDKNGAKVFTNRYNVFIIKKMDI